MSLYTEWNEALKNIKTQEEYQNFFKDYMAKEAECYRKILESKSPVIEGKVVDLSKHNDMTSMEYIGFLDGANTSFKEGLDLDSLTEESVLKAELDWEKLLWNMHDAKAEWLYGMNEWSNIFDDDKRKKIKKDFNRSKQVIAETKIGRNDPCPCGSGKKYKKCCGK
ncbi:MULTISPECIES: SEC-C metal-binding domain-containing protein [unclassified Sedimentibacter]|uniref:SEC-C metal-binding domain-containing protein n=1 Tax=unclassified Sedimentibacter TaxID=2649220 RepID=UPI0027DFEE7B|nr:SEC-C metal-binding domain-containing protein [Sedimentibacter sp. MB35-C1]WMJ78176.1 SEC-C metal-binding domain-containing protein [Sedimentibacter sp. MB35-C1]